MVGRLNMESPLYVYIFYEFLDVFMWKSRCQYLGCLSEHECFLRRPQENCPLPFCKHQPDCIAKTENEKCYGWICPRDQQCVTKTFGPCHNNNNCRILRSCADGINIDSSNFNNRPFTKVYNFIALFHFFFFFENTFVYLNNEIIKKNN